MITRTNRPRKVWGTLLRPGSLLRNGSRKSLQNRGPLPDDVRENEYKMTFVSGVYNAACRTEAMMPAALPEKERCRALAIRVLHIEITCRARSRILSSDSRRQSANGWIRSRRTHAAGHDSGNHGRQCRAIPRHPVCSAACRRSEVARPHSP